MKVEFTSAAAAADFFLFTIILKQGKKSVSYITSLQLLNNVLPEMYDNI